MLRGARRPAAGGVTFWTEGGASIGMGHLARCVNLARELEMRGIRSGFLVNKDAAAAGRLSQEGLDYLYCALDDMGGVDLTRATVVIDTKRDVSAQVSALKKAGRQVITIENLSAVADSDAVVIPSPVFAGTQVRGKVFAGAEYVIMGKGFIEARKGLKRRRYTRPLKVLVTMGGADPNNLTGFVVDVLKDVRDIEVTVVIGPACRSHKRLENLTRGMATPFTFVTGVTDLAPYMRQAHVAFTAVGTTVYELAYMGVPSVIIANYESDRDYLRVFEALGISESLGFYRDVRGRDIVEAVRTFLKDPSICRAMSGCALEMTDGQGAARIADLIAARTVPAKHGGSRTVKKAAG
ncbi:MAG: PseG/SpsG family protein [Thermodesulfobacteriota bacterium]